MFEVILAMKATMVVVEVRRIALPTLLIEVRAANSGLAPSLLSSLYLCSACRLSSMPKASTKIGRRLENCERNITSIPYLCPRMIAHPISPCIHISERTRPTTTMATSDTLLRLSHNRTVTTNVIIKIRYALESNSRFISTLTPSANIRVTTISSVDLKSSSRAK